MSNRVLPPQFLYTLNFKSIIALLFLLAWCAPAQVTCTPASDESYVNAEIALLIEPFEIEGGCSTATIRKGQKFVWLRADVYAYDFEGNWAEFEYQLSVKVNGFPVYSVNSLTFDTGAECEFGTTCNRYVEKLVDVSAFTWSGSAQLEVLAHAVRPPVVNSPGHYGHVYTLLAVYPRSRFLLSDTRQDYRPRNSDSADPVAATCNSGYDCYPSFEARLQEACCDVKIGFELSDMSTLSGVSTNYGSGNGPDYVIDPELNQGLVAASAPSGTVAYEIAEPWTMANLLISSMDYGGKAKVKAYFLAPETGQKIYAEVVEDLEQPPEPHSTMARQFARLPYDEDDDGMADGWESEIGGPNPSADEDGEPGGGAPGDGLSAHDEYRGFHWLDGSTAKHVRTDPQATKDVFFWDAESSGQLTSGLEMLMRNELSGVVYHPVNSVFARHDPSLSPPLSVGFINAWSDTQVRAHAVPYTYGTLTDDALGYVGDVLGRSPQPIVVDSAAIPRAVADYANIWPNTTLHALVIAHETGHRFFLKHHSRLCSVRPQAPNQDPYASLPNGEYALDTANTRVLYVRLGVFEHAGGWALSEFPDLTQGVLEGNMVAGVDWESPIPVPGQGLPERDAVFRITVVDPITSVGSELAVLTQENYIMDWRHRHKATNSSPGDWDFRSDHVNAVKVNAQ